MNTKEYKNILQMAIDNEMEAYEFYKSAMGKVKDNNLKSVFENLAEEEMKHKNILENFFNNEAKPLKFRETKDYKISETLDTPKLSVDMKFADAIALAIKKEEEAMDMYNNFAVASIEEEQKNVFLELAKMEQGHKARLEDIYTNVAYVEVW